MLKQLWNDEAGVIISAELVLVLTIGVLMLVVGLHSVSKAVTFELGDLAQAFGAVDQTYKFDGFSAPGGTGNPDHSLVRGTGSADEADDCDCIEIIETIPTDKADPSARNVGENAP